MLRTARTLPAVTLFIASFLATASMFAGSPAQAPEVVAHEWGTFTTVAGEDGQAIQWLPLGGPTDLPCFVQRFKNPLFKVMLNNEQEGPVDYNTARSALTGTVRMETPVIYFYSPDATTVSVNVRFPRGLITEWYPTATVNQPVVLASVLANPNVTSGISWPTVQIAPGRPAAFPNGSQKSHYYAARETDAAPLWVAGQEEKFLFYRGVGNFPSVISTALNADGSVKVANLGKHEIPAVIYFENRAGQISYRLGGSVSGSAMLARPAAVSSFAALRADLVKMLVSTGLFEKEAHAMVETWRDTWFEEGSRIFYLVPPKAVDEILPLTIAPAPAAVARAFIGRMELITPDALVRVQTALASGNDAALEQQGRFLGPIADRLIARTTSVSDRNRIRAVTNTVFAAYVKKFGACSQ